MADPSHAEAILHQRFENTVVARSFGIDVALDRVRRFARAAHAQAGFTMSLDDFIVASLDNGISQNLPPLCVAFFAYTTLGLHVTDRISADTLELGWTQWCALVDPDPWLIVPTRLFVPFQGTKRSESALQRTDMLPLFFTRSDGGMGVSVAADADYEAIPNTPTRMSGTSLKVTLNLLNYSPYERQIQLRCPADGTISARRLARLVAAKTRDCIEKASQENANIARWENPHWKFGTEVDCFHISDVILLGIIFVSPGKVTPLLKVRSEYAPLAPFDFDFDFNLFF